VLAEVGIARPAEALVEFLRDPTGYKAAFRASAVAALLARGDEAAAQGASARALKFYGRVLALDPDDPQVAPRLTRLRRRKLRRRAAAWAAGVALVVPLGWVGVVQLKAQLLRARPVAVPSADAAAWLPEPAAPSTSPATDDPTAARGTGVTSAPAAAIPDPAPAPSSPAPPAASSPTPPPAAGAGHAPPRPSAPTPTPQAATPPLTPTAHAGSSAETTLLSVYVRPYAQRALLDGVEVARGQQQVTFELRPGSHVIQIEHACCTPFVRQITAEEAGHQGELRIPLEPRPARLRVEGDPATRVFVDGKPYGTAGDSQRAPFAVPLQADADNPYERAARIGLELAGGISREIQVRLRAGGEVTVAAPESEVPP
jgi:serine/threonine-protein kinase